MERSEYFKFFWLEVVQVSVSVSAFLCFYMLTSTRTPNVMHMASILLLFF